MTDPSVRKLGTLLIVAGVVTSVLWLKSLDAYLGARFHISLENELHPSFFAPSELLRRSLDDLSVIAILPTPQHSSLATPVTGVAIAGSIMVAMDHAVNAAPITEIPLHSVTKEVLPPQKAISKAPPLAAQPMGAVRTCKTTLTELDECAVPSVDDKPPLGLTTSLSMPAAGDFFPSLSNQSIDGPQRILFAGDSMMQGVAPLVIRELAKQNPDWKMYDYSRQSTGLTVKRYFDWPTKINQEITAKDLTMVVIFLGPNDPWDIYLPGRRLSFPSPQWEQGYADRVDEILTFAASRNVAVIWVGLPSMGDRRLHTGAAIQNRIFYTQSKIHQTDYLAIEPLIGLTSLPFSKSNNPLGKRVVLRAGDGVHFSIAGLQLIKQSLLAHLGKMTAS